jgi:hypothetical protein
MVYTRSLNARDWLALSAFEGDRDRRTGASTHAWFKIDETLWE